MVTAIEFKSMLYGIKEKGYNRKTIGILFANPDEDIVGREILPKLNYLHHRSKKKIDFFFPGYGQYWNESYAPDFEDVITIEGNRWLFSNKKYVEFIEELEKDSKWEYSGETDLIIIEYINDCLDFKNAIIININNAYRCKSIPSSSRLFEIIFREFEKGKITPYELSDILALRFGGTIKEFIIDLIPGKMGDTVKSASKVYEQLNMFAIRNIEK